MVEVTITDNVLT